MIRPIFKIKVKGKIFEKEGPEVIHRRMLEGISEATGLLEKEIKERTPIGVYGAKGGLRSAIFGEVIDYGASVKGILGHSSPYGDVIEYGRRAGRKMPPAGSLLRWIEIKIGAVGKEAQRIEFVIRRKIGEKGFPGVRMFENAWKQNRSKVENILKRLGFKITEDLNK